MSKSLIHLAFAAATFSLVACSGDQAGSGDGDHGHEHGAEDGHDHGAEDDHGHADGDGHGHDSDTVVTATHAVACGCSLEEYGACGNYVEVGGKYIELKGDVGLGAMEFCGQEGLHASLSGSVQDGAFVATSYKLSE